MLLDRLVAVNGNGFVLVSPAFSGWTALSKVKQGNGCAGMNRQGLLFGKRDPTEGRNVDLQ